MLRNNIKKVIIIVILFFIILFNSMNYKPFQSSNRYLIYTFNTCNNELAYAINNLSGKINSASEEMLNDEEYIKQIFNETYLKLRFWEKILVRLELLNENFKFENATELREYFYIIMDKGKLSEKDREVLEIIFKNVNKINPGKEQEIDNKYFRVAPSKEVKEALENIFEICKEEVARYYLEGGKQ